MRSEKQEGSKNDDGKATTDKKKGIRQPIDPKQRKKVVIFYLISVALLLLYLGIWEWLPNATIYDGLTVMGLAFLALVPAFLTDALMPLVANIPGIKRYPLDFGKYHRDGRRILGEGKSWNGLILGTLVGFGLSVWIANSIYPQMYALTVKNFSDGQTVLQYITEEDILGFLDIENHRAKLYTALFLISLSTPIGDAIGSYYKRRRNVGRGEVFIFLDQNDFIILGGLVAWAFYPFTWYYYIILLLMTPILTITFSAIAYFLGFKTHPW